MVFIVVKFKTRPECTGEWLDKVAALTTATRGEEGNLWFEWSKGIDDPDEFVLLEAFRDEGAGARHVTSDHFACAMRELPNYLAETPRIVKVSVPGNEWSLLSEMSRS